LDLDPVSWHGMTIIIFSTPAAITAGHSKEFLGWALTREIRARRHHFPKYPERKLKSRLCSLLDIQSVNLNYSFV